MTGLTTHVLDLAGGRPAAAVAVVAEYRAPGGSEWSEIGRGVTDRQGRLTLVDGALAAGDYRLVFDSGAYFQALGADAFYPEIAVRFRVTTPADHYHVPLLLSPFGYTTYRGA